MMVNCEMFQISLDATIYGPLFHCGFFQERLILQTIHVLSKEILQINMRFTIKSGFNSRVDYNGACTVIKKESGLWINFIAAE
jgi:hypothetical protein